jgi:DNA uptake protein ComE-like DNA-binding protein
MSPSPTVATRSRWPWLSLLPLGLGSWTPIYAGVRASCRSWMAWGSLWTAISLAGWILSTTSKHDNGIGGLCLIVGWVGAIATSFSIRGSYERQMSSPLLQATEAGQQRLQDRQRALALARQNPVLAREIGVGRPDQTGAVDSGLVDVNNVSVTALLKLPGVTGEIATEIIETREKVNGFSTLEDMGETLDLDGGVIERLRGEVVFLPRR